MSEHLLSSVQMAQFVASGFLKFEDMVPRDLCEACLEEMANMYAGVNTFGTPEQILEKIGEQRRVLDCDVDVLTIAKYGGMTDQEAAGSMRLFAEKVMPALRGA